MGIWLEIKPDHLIQLLDDGGILWEHNTVPGYPVLRHIVSPKRGAVWGIVQLDPLTLSPSLHCDPALHGCGLHGFILDGEWR